MVTSRFDSSALLRALLDTALEAVSAERTLAGHLPPAPPGRTVLLAVGKAAFAMAEVALKNWRGPISGLVVTRYGDAAGRRLAQPDIELLEANHPTPDDNSVTAARRALELVAGLSPNDLVLVLVSGGGSSLWCAPIAGVSLAGKQAITKQLLLRGAGIGELNTVRKWLSRIKGGRLAIAAAPARVATLMISDVARDDPALIASGPTIVGPSSCEDFKRILERYQVTCPGAVLDAAEQNPPPERLGAGQQGHHALIAVSNDALNAAAALARDLGYEAIILGDPVEGDARDAAQLHAKLALEIKAMARPAIILSGGEVTVKVNSKRGVGGPNTEFLLALALRLEGASNIFALACDTDGFDGIGQNAGAIIRPDTLQRADRLHIDPVQELHDNNSAGFFEALNDLVITGPTQTNVSDFRAIIVNPR